MITSEQCYAMPLHKTQDKGGRKTTSPSPTTEPVLINLMDTTQFHTARTAGCQWKSLLRVS